MTEMQSWSSVLTSLLAREDLSVADAAWAMDQVMTGEATEAQLAAFLVALRAKGETVDEIVGFRDAILDHAVPLDVDPMALDIVGMRQRMRRELDRGDAQWFDLKQGEGGLVDLEFLLQALVLRHAEAHPALCTPRRTVDLVAALAAAGVLDNHAASALLQAHATLSSLGLACTLDRRLRRVPHGVGVDAARATIRAACRDRGLDFSLEAAAAG